MSMRNKKSMKSIHNNKIPDWLIAKVIFVTCLFLCGCGSDDDITIVQADPIPKVIVYGRDSCGITTVTKSELDNEEIPYAYKDIDITENTIEMWNKVRATSWYQGGGVGLPVVDVRGTVMERPSIEEIKSALYDQ